MLSNREQQEREQKRDWAMSVACEINNRLRIGMSDDDLEKTIKILLKRANPIHEGRQ